MASQKLGQKDWLQIFFGWGLVKMTIDLREYETAEGEWRNGSASDS
jgi:hypothetical protein